MRWYVIQAYSGYEAQVVRTLLEYIAQHQMEAKFGDILVPTEEVVEVKDGKRRRSERKFFPGYVLIQAEMDEEVWHLVNSVPRVIGFVGGKSDQPRPITQKEADQILNRIAEAEEGPRLKVLYEVGEEVRIVDGAFKEFNGVVEEIDTEKARLVVSVMIFGRATPVELEFSQVERV